MRFLFLYTFLVLVRFSLIAQTQSLEISGFVKDAANLSPIDFANVYIETNDGTILAFCNSDAQGFYVLQMPRPDADSLKLLASMLGYNAQQRWLSVKTIDKKHQQDFLLSPTAFDIKEVIVEGVPPSVVVKNDTTTYHLSAFTDGTEHSVEDALKKLPGLRVAEGGAITVNGKAIEKVLVEGDDIFGFNYTIGTRNISASAIDKIQIIDHFQDNPALKGIEHSDKMVLNLGIKASKKNIWTGTLSLGVGKSQQQPISQLAANVFLLSKKSKTFFLGNGNNTGFNAAGEVAAIFGDNVTPLETYRLYDTPNPLSLSLPSHFTALREAGFLNISQVFRPNETWRIRVTGTQHKINTKQYLTEENSFFSESDTLHFVEKTHFAAAAKTSLLTLQTDYFPKSAKHSLQILCDASQETQATQLNINRTEDARQYPLAFILKDQPLALVANAKYIHKTGKYAAWQLTTGLRYRYNNQTFNGFAPFYAAYYIENYLYEKLTQDNQIYDKIFISNIKYIYNKNIYNSFELESKQQSGRISISNLLSSENTTNIPPKPLSKEFWETSNIRSNIFQANYKAEKDFNNFQVGISINGNFNTFLIENKGKILIDTNYWRLAAQLRVKLTIGENAQIRAYYKHFVEEVKHEDVLQIAFLKAYQSLWQGTLDASPISRREANVGYYYKNILRFLSFRASIGHSFSFNSLALSSNFLKPLLEYKPLRGTNDAQTTIVASVDKFVNGLSSRFFLQADFSRRTFQADINNKIFDTKLYSYALHGEYGTAFDGWVNCFVDNKFRLQQFSNNALGQTTTLKSTYIENQARLRLSLSPLKTLKADIDFYVLANKTQGQHGWAYTHIVEAKLSFRPKTTSSGNFELVVSNALNQNALYMRHFQAYSMQSLNIETRPRLLMLKWSVPLEFR